ncbi:MAG: M20/M25/M40 family metallo-hydrolase [bacterium]|nr:M20/M25/M40 family metallo-hydrolase [bacterium]
MRLCKFKNYACLLIVGLLCTNTNIAQRSNCSNALSLVKTDSLYNFMQELIGKKEVIINGNPQLIKSRYAFHSGNALAATYLANTCASYGFTIRNIDYSSTGRNVIAEKVGSQFPNKSIMLCAHYDCVGGTNSNFQGADDNASGCAALLEAARVLRNIDFPYTIQLAFWDEEEAGLIGSKAFPSGGSGLPELLTVINLDMIAWDGNKDSLAMIHATPSVPLSLDFADRLHHVIGKHKLPLKSFVKNPGEPNTDHQSFWNRDIPAIGLTEDYDNDFSPNWHRFSDSIENIHIPYFVNMSKLAIMALCEFAQEGLTGLPKLVSGKEFEIYPNPIDHHFCIKSENLNVFNKLQISNLTGEILFEAKDLSQGKNYFILPENFAPGLYFVSLFGSNQHCVTKKIVVNK